MNTQYIFIYPDGQYVAMDSNSGGYPYPTENLFQANPWYDSVQIYYDGI